jgi:hypothetical protein
VYLKVELKGVFKNTRIDFKNILGFNSKATRGHISAW